MGREKRPGMHRVTPEILGNLGESDSVSLFINLYI